MWLYLDRVKEGYAKKLAHLWHGPFRVLELVGEHAARLELRDTKYRLFPIVHISKLKRVVEFPDRPCDLLTVNEADRVDFDECLLPEDSWARELEEGEYEVKDVLKSRVSNKTRYGRQRREFLIRWKGQADPSWVDEVNLNCGALLREFERKVTNHNRFDAMQSHED